MFYNWNVIGHEKELVRLETDLAQNALHHAYLLVGPESIGKFRVAKTLAAILQCPNNFCRTCPTCIQVEKKCHADTIEIENEGDSLKIGLMREVLARLAMTSQSRYKVVLIEHIGRFTEEAANALLKTLEEPTGSTVFIFTANQVKDVLPTIASRMRIIHFKMTPIGVLRDELKKRYPETDPQTLNQAVTLSMGRSGQAFKLLDNPEILREFADIYAQIEFLHEHAGFATRFMKMGEIAKDETLLERFLTLSVHYLRNKMYETGDRSRTMQLIASIERIHAVLNLLRRNVNTRLLLEHTMLHA